MDLDVFVTAHGAEWDRLETLLRRRRRLTGAEADELVVLYQRTTTHLSLLLSSAPDPALTGRLTSLVARARSKVTGARPSSWRDAARFFTASFPAFARPRGNVVTRGSGPPADLDAVAAGGGPATARRPDDP